MLQRERTGNISKRLREIKHYEKKYGVAFSGYETEQGNIKDINYLDLNPVTTATVNVLCVITIQ